MTAPIAAFAVRTCAAVVSAARTVDPGVHRVSGQLHGAQRRVHKLVELGLGHVRFATMRAVIPGIVICAGMLTAACGVKGPLYLPNVPKDTAWPYRTTKPPPA